MIMQIEKSDRSCSCSQRLLSRVTRQAIHLSRLAIDVWPILPGAGDASIDISGDPPARCANRIRALLYRVVSRSGEKKRQQLRTVRGEQWQRLTANEMIDVGCRGFESRLPLCYSHRTDRNAPRT